MRALRPLEFRGQRGQEQLGIGEHGERRRLVGAEHVAVDVDLDHLLLGRMPPVRRLAPPVGLAESRTHDQHDVGVVAYLVVELDVRHRDGERDSSRAARRAPAQLVVTGACSSFGDATQLVVGCRVDHAAAGVDHRQIGCGQHVGGLRDLVRRRHDRVRVAVLLRLPDGDFRLDLAVHDRFRHVEVHHARPSVPAVAKRGAAEFGDAIERDDRVAPLRDVLDHADLVEAW